MVGEQIQRSGPIAPGFPQPDLCFCCVTFLSYLLAVSVSGGIPNIDSFPHWKWNYVELDNILKEVPVSVIGTHWPYLSLHFHFEVKLVFYHFYHHFIRKPILYDRFCWGGKMGIPFHYLLLPVPSFSTIVISP